MYGSLLRRIWQRTAPPPEVWLVITKPFRMPAILSLQNSQSLWALALLLKESASANFTLKECSRRICAWPFTNMSPMSASLTRKLSWQILLCPLPTLRSHAASPAALPFPEPSVRKPGTRPPIFEICGNPSCRLAVPQQEKTKQKKVLTTGVFKGQNLLFLFAGMK